MQADYFSEASKTFDRLAETMPAGLVELRDAILQTWEEGGKVISFGNGGSATDSLHFTTELVAKFNVKPIQRPALSLSASPSTLTAVSNDWSFEEVFSRQVKALGNAKDVFVGISTSGNSPNVLRGLKAALEVGGRTFGLTDAEGGKLQKLDVELINVPATRTAHVQEAHIACLHWVCDQIDRKLNS